MPELSAAQLDAVADAVRAVVTRDAKRLATIARRPDDLYLWTHGYGRHGSVDLVMPPGPPSQWQVESTDVAGKRGMHVVVPMWTRQEGRSDLSLELELHDAGSGEWAAAILDLHVL